MLTEISIKNLGVIESTTVELSPGLTVLTGETGAGKTMVVTGLRLIAGNRADASRVRSQAKKAEVEGIFSTEKMAQSLQSELASLVEDSGGSPDESGEFITTRTVSKSGRSRAYLGGRSVPAATLAKFTEPLLTIHGQNDQLRLLGADQQLEILDAFDPAINPLLNEYKETYSQWRKLAKDYRRRTESTRELAREADQLSFAINEINEVDPQTGEDEELTSSIRRMQDADALREAAVVALTAIDGTETMGQYSEEDPASTLIGRASDALQGSEDIALQQLGSELAEISSRLGSITAELGSYLADLSVDPAELDRMLTRQQDLRSLIRKYGADINDVLAYRDKAQQRLNGIDTSSEAIEELKKQLVAVEKELKAAAKKLSQKRRQASKELSSAVTSELRNLAMPKARIEVSVESVDPGPSGIDEVELRLAPNDGSEAKPLASAASGGELSRVMLAIEVIASRGVSGATFVFDEVDAGVGGRAAVEIGRRLARLAVDNQVLVVTHLPQVAAYADTHIHVAKDVGDESVTSGVSTLSDEQRIEELARMLAGLDDTDTGRAHAKELLQRARRERQDF